MSELLTAALKYAKAGYRVHPCHKDKTPILKAWQKKASADPEQIKIWWTEWPNASIGCACGPESGVWVLDVDLPDGPENLENLIKEYGPLPETLEQITGSGGRQLFFNYNGTEIRNSASKFTKDVDVRGNGGFVILPPSPHPSGNNYQWEVKKKPAAAPEWLIELVKYDEPILTITHTDKTSLYGKKALADEIMNVSCSGEGSRNDTLNKAAYCIGQLVAGGCIDEGQATAGLMGAAIAAGLKQKEAAATIKSGFRSGAAQPRTAPQSDDDKYYFADEIEDTKQTKQTKHDKANKAELSETKQDKAELSNTKQDLDPNRTYNLTALITEYVKNSSGSFTVADIDREFCLKTRKEKNNRSWALNKIINTNLIYRDKSVNGKYHILDSGLDVIDLNAPAEESFPISLPFNIHEKVVIPPHGIILLAGSSNAGKTAFVLNTLWLNRMRSYGKLYLMSEMGTGEYITRIKKFSHNWKAEWAAIKAASRSYDFQGAIEHHNKNGLTCVDYLEESGGEYFKIASNIRDVYDCLGDGVCLIAIQKQSKNEIGRGGEGTLEKARLYMTLDYLATGEKSIICALKLVKIKNYIGTNLQNHEIHFRLSEGHKIDPLTNWMLSSKIDRDAYKRKYESQIDDLPEKVAPGDILIRLTDGNIKRITEADARRWQKELYSVDVFAELNRISKSKPFLTKENYFFSLSGILKKQHEKNIKQGG